MITTVSNCTIQGFSLCVPRTEVRLADTPGVYGGDKAKLKRVMDASGFDCRRVAGPSTTAADLCEAAAQTLLTKLDVDRTSIQACVMVTQTPDYLIPTTACILQNRLGLSTATASFDINQGCAGFVYGLWVAGNLLSSQCRRVLLLAGDTYCKFGDMFRNGSAPVFGDGGSATLLEYAQDAPVMTFDIGSDGSKYDAIIARNSAMRHTPQRDMFYADGTYQYAAGMNGLQVMDFTLSVVPNSIRAALNAANTPPEEMDYFVLHQANKMIVQNIAADLGQPLDKFPIRAISTLGNLTSASIPSAIALELSDALTTPKDICFSGFGVGLSWGSAVAKKVCPKVIAMTEYGE